MKGTIACRITGLLLCCQFALQAQVWDDFSDGDFTNGITWIGDTNRFIVAGGQLQLQGSGSDSSFLSTLLPLTIADTLEWGFRIRLNFSPSSSNYSRFYLISNSPVLEGSLQGYFLQYGESGSADAIQLCYQNGNTITVIHRATDSLIGSGCDTRVKVLYFVTGQWELWVDYSGAYDYVKEFSASNSLSFSAGYLGWRCNYTSSNASAFYLDDVYAGAYRFDTLPPVLKESLLSGDTLLLRFNESIDSLNPDFASAFRLEDGSLPTAVQVRESGKCVALNFNLTITPGTPYRLFIQHISDLNGNAWKDTSQLLFFRSAIINPSDLLISEIMANPSGAPSLPEVEYIELYNQSTKALTTNGVIISDGSTNAMLQGDTLLPGQYRAYCKSGLTDLFPDSLRKLFRSCIDFPSLNNDGDKVILRHTDGFIVDRVDYDPGMYSDPLRDDYGWSFERKDLLLPCFNRMNWGASRSITGGTPGYENSNNSTFEDTLSIWIEYAQLLDSHLLALKFSEAPDTGDAQKHECYLISDGIQITEIRRDSLQADILHAVIDRTPAADKSYVINICTSLRDCSGNPIARWLQAQFGWPQQIRNQDIIINEIMFNPRSGEGDYVEITKLSEGCIRLSDLRLASADPLTGEFESTSPFTESPQLICGPGYAVAASLSEEVKQHYRSDDPRMIVESYLPSLPDDEGTIVLLNKELTEMDRFSYKDDYHHPLLADPEGVALERLASTVPTQNPSNWHSASAASGFGSPASRNSQSLNTSGSPDSWLVIEPVLFSPDNDGYHDYVQIRSSLPTPGYMADMQILDENGQEVAVIGHSELLEPESRWIWDGQGPDGNLLAPGIYILAARFFHINGDVKQIKKAMVIALRD